jgi:hypothetical protein
MSNYTPAPWRAHKLPNGSHHIIADHWGASVAVTMFPDNGSEGREANALLIAAAPDMLDALEKCRKWVAQYHDLPGHNAASRRMTDYLDRIIATATGESA